MWRRWGVLAAALGLVAVVWMSYGMRSTQSRRLSGRSRPAAALQAVRGQPAAAKQLICHVADDAGALIIEVAERAVPVHLRNHGDCIINSTDRALIGDDCNPT